MAKKKTETCPGKCHPIRHAGPHLGARKALVSSLFQLGDLLVGGLLVARGTVNLRETPGGCT